MAVILAKVFYSYQSRGACNLTRSLMIIIADPNPMAQPDRIIHSSGRRELDPLPELSFHGVSTLYHLTFWPLSLGLSRYLIAEIEAWASASEGALSPIKAYSSREIPSGLFNTGILRPGAC